MSIKNIKSYAIFSPIRFYYSFIKKDINMRERELERNQSLNSLLFVPLMLFLLSTIVAILFINIFTVGISLLFLLFTILNMVVINIQTNEYNDRKREEELERIRKRDEELKERIRKETERQYYEWIRQKREAERQRVREEASRRAQERLKKERERANREWSYDYGYYSNRQEEQIDQNMVNAKKLLGLKDGFTKSDVKFAYRKLSKIHHPDTSTGTEENFKRLNTAYKYIMDRI